MRSGALALAVFRRLLLFQRVALRSVARPMSARRRVVLVIGVSFIATQAWALSPDLIPQNISVTPDPASPNGAITVNWTLKNQGNATASTSTTVVRVESSNTCPVVAQAQVATAALVAGGSVPQSASRTAPASGSYYVCVI